ncbi:ATP-binding protein [Streptomyces diacarni]|uniref:ATP-binding protein n=1 Tax=Streptomyces diacarni TaxID=2800381 RepID=UPI0033F64489
MVTLHRLAGAEVAIVATAAAPVVRQPLLGCFEADFDPADAHVSQMRRMTAHHLRSWGLEELVDSATLVVSELTTNAVRHGHGRVSLRVQWRLSLLRIEVADGNPTPARMRPASKADENGRGLVLVASLAEDWGVDKDGTTTWASLTLPERKA